jgi:hypothetical protein
MFKKIAIAAPMAVLALSSSIAFAAEDMTSIINIKATIPTSIFHAQPRDPNFGKDETLSYNVVSGELSSLRAIYDLKHSDAKGSINAYIEGGPTKAALYNGSNAIPLTVAMGSTVLDGTSKEIVNAADATPGTQLDMVITAAKPAADQVGDYTGDFTVVFEPKLAP